MSIEAMKQALETLEDIFGKNKVDVGAINALRQAIEQAEKKEKTTVDDNSQNWAGMDGAIAWHLIHRHADGWGDVGKMMDEWREANTTPLNPMDSIKSSKTLDAQPKREFVGLTDGQYRDIAEQVIATLEDRKGVIDLCFEQELVDEIMLEVTETIKTATEAKLKEKNT